MCWQRFGKCQMHLPWCTAARMVAGMKLVLSVLCLSMLAGCGGLKLPEFKIKPDRGFADASPPEGTIRPRARPGGLAGAAGYAPPENARTVEDFDTTSFSERKAAAMAPEVDGKLGVTVASLGSPTEPGFWLKTPLTQVQGPGMVIYPATGKSVRLTLIPIEGAKTAGSRMSLAALRLIGAPLTGLAKVDVFRAE